MCEKFFLYSMFLYLNASFLPIIVADLGCRSLVRNMPRRAKETNQSYNGSALRLYWGRRQHRNWETQTSIACAARFHRTTTATKLAAFKSFDSLSFSLHANDDKAAHSLVLITVKME